jgi:hypothetical protein
MILTDKSAESPRDRAVKAANVLIASFFECQRYRINCGKWAAETLKLLGVPMLAGSDPSKEAIDCLKSFRNQIGLNAVPTAERIDYLANQLMQIYNSLRAGTAAEIDTRDSRRKEMIARELRRKERRNERV